MFKEDTEIAYFKFDKNFKETLRFGEEKELLEGLSPEDFELRVEVEQEEEETKMARESIVEPTEAKKKKKKKGFFG